MYLPLIRAASCHLATAASTSSGANAPTHNLCKPYCGLRENRSAPESPAACIHGDKLTRLNNCGSTAHECKPYGGAGEGCGAHAAHANGAHSTTSELPTKPEGLVMLAPDIDLSRMPCLRNASPRVRQGLVDRMMFVVGLLLHRALLFGGTNFHPLHARTLGRLVGPRHLRAMLAALIRGGVIKCDRLYIVGKKARGYHLAPWVLKRRIIDVTLNRELTLAVKRYSNGGTTSRPPAHPAHRIIYDNLHHLTVEPTAWQILGENESASLPTRAQWIHTLQVIERGMFTLSASDTTGRVFTALTGTARILRPYLRLDGHVPAEVDVRACQPYLLATLYPAGSTERDRYVTAVTQGDFYELFLRAPGEPPGRPRRPYTRAGIKQAVQVEVLFGGIEHRRSIWAHFATEFPELAGLMDNFIATSHITLAAHLQRMEAEIVIGRVVPRLHQRLHGRPFLTIHDSIFCIAQDAPAVAGVMREEFAARVGAEPFVKIVQLAPD